ncbi:MAG: hypothetical protein ACLGIO_14245 [Acidimicrobiia bacterium]
MSATPAQVADDAVRIAVLAGDVARAYAWLHDSGYARETARARVGTGRTTVTDEHGETMPPTPDPTGESALGQRAIRAKLAFCARATLRARDQLAGALVALHEIAELVDAAAGHEPDDDGHDRRIPRTVTKAEVARARAAQRRRIARGEGLPAAGRAA